MFNINKLKEIKKIKFKKIDGIFLLRILRMQTFRFDIDGIEFAFYIIILI